MAKRRSKTAPGGRKKPITGAQRAARKRNIKVARESKKRGSRPTKSDLMSQRAELKKKHIALKTKSESLHATNMKIIKKYGKKWDGIGTASKADQKTLRAGIKKSNRINEKMRKLEFEMDHLAHKSLTAR